MNVSGHMGVNNLTMTFSIRSNRTSANIASMHSGSTKKTWMKYIACQFINFKWDTCTYNIPFSLLPLPPLPHWVNSPRACHQNGLGGGPRAVPLALGITSRSGLTAIAWKGKNGGTYGTLRGGGGGGRERGSARENWEIVKKITAGRL